MEIDQRFWIAGPSLLLAIFLFCEFSLFSILLCGLCLLSGLKLGEWFLQVSDGRLFELQVQENDSRSSSRKISASQIDDKLPKAPWNGLFAAKSVNNSLEQFMEQVVESFVSNWYEPGISNDKTFLNEIRYQLRFACSRLMQKVSIEDLKKIIIEEALPHGSLHLQKVITASECLKPLNLPPSLLEVEISKKFGFFHYALGSRNNEVDYLRQVANYLLPLLFDDTRLAGRPMDEESPRHVTGRRKNQGWPSLSSCHLLRELLVHSMLLPLLDLIADPDVINHLLILLFDSANVQSDEIQQEAQVVPFLHGLTESATEVVPDSLLQLKLSELLRDQRQFSMFRMYLQDTRGPVNELAFLAEADRLHEVMQKRTECSSQISYDIWQLYGQFVHEGSPEKVFFESDMVDEFRKAIEANDLIGLEKILEKSYQHIYARLQWLHVVPFCQSDIFLGHLCGSPPIALDMISLPADLSQRASITEKTFSLAQFRARLRKALLLDADEMEANDLIQDPIEVNMLLGSPGSVDQKLSTDSSTTMVENSMPSIDVTTTNGEDYDPLSTPVDECEDESTVDSGITSSTEPLPYLLIDAENRDLGRWGVSIPKVVPAKDPINGRTMFVYQIHVIRHDAQSHETKTWTLWRRYNEFYVLEGKLNEFHRDSLCIPTLPPRKSFVAKTRAFIEQNRLSFAAFLGNLCRQKQLARSDLLFAFLASDEEFRDSLLISDLNPWRVVKKMPGKLARERGQNLRPFILGMLATTLGSPTNNLLNLPDNKEDTSSISSSSNLESEVPQSFYSPIFGNNLPTARIGNGSIKENCIWFGKNEYLIESFMLLIRSCLQSTFISSIVAIIRKLFSITFDVTVRNITSKILRLALCDQNLVQLIRLAEQSIFCAAEQPPPTDQEKALRCELARRKTVDWIEESLPTYSKKFLGEQWIRTTVLEHLAALQHPRLNKQLTYVLLDSIVKKFFIE